MRNRFLLGAAAVAVAAPAFAQNANPPATPDVVVAGSRIAAPADRTPYSAEVIPPAQLRGRESVADALSDTADIFVAVPGGRSGQAAVYLRGADPNFTGVLLDGVPLNNPTNSLGGSVNLSEIAALEIERVEVIAGPLSSLYGSGALAGVVNLVAPGGDASHRLEATVGLGTVDDYRGQLRWRGPVGARHGGSLALTGDDAGDAAEPSRFRSLSLLGKVAPLDGRDGGRLVFRVARTEALAFPDSSGGVRLAERRELEERDGREALVGGTQPVSLGANWRLLLSGSLLHRRDETASPGVAPTGTDPFGVPAGEDDTRYLRLLAQAAVRHDGGDWQAVGGVESQREDARSRGALDFGVPVPSSFDDTRWTYSGFLEAGRTLDGFVLNAGGRIDAIDGEGTRVTGRAGVRYRLPGSGWSLRAAAGTGFKAPSFYAIGNPFVGNPDLRPERSRSVEAGVDRAWAGGGASLTAFRTVYRNLIDFVPDPFPQLRNRGEVAAEGVSASASHAVARTLTASVQAQYVDMRDRDSDERLLNRPRWTAAAILSWAATDRLTLTGRHRYAGLRRAFSVPTGTTRLSGYHLLSLEAGWAATDDLVARVIVDNLLDEDAEDAIGFRSPGSRARLLVSRSF